MASCCMGGLDMERRHPRASAPNFQEHVQSVYYVLMLDVFAGLKRRWRPFMRYRLWLDCLVDVTQSFSRPPSEKLQWRLQNGRLPHRLIGDQALGLLFVRLLGWLWKFRLHTPMNVSGFSCADTSMLCVLGPERFYRCSRDLWMT